MSLTEEERQAIVFYRLEKARQSLDETWKVYPLEVWSIIANSWRYGVSLPIECILHCIQQGCDYDDFIDAKEEDMKRYLPQVESLINIKISLINNK